LETELDQDPDLNPDPDPGLELITDQNPDPSGSGCTTLAYTVFRLSFSTLYSTQENSSWTSAICSVLFTSIAVIVCRKTKKKDVLV
jgi:hypothetical protein